jgi:hypothetical protein
MSRVCVITSMTIASRFLIRVMCVRIRPPRSAV